MKFWYCILFFVLLSITGRSQKPAIPEKGISLSDFVPSGWSILKTASVKFNNDTLTDYVMVLNHNNEDDMPNTNRILLIVYRTNEGYSRSCVSYEAVMCKDCGGVFGDPFEGIEIKKNVLWVYHYGGSSWRWSYTHKFRYQNGDWLLIGKTVHHYHNVENCESVDEFVGDYKDENLVTGDVMEKIIDEKCNKKESKAKVQPKPLIRLSEFNQYIKN